MPIESVAAAKRSRKYRQHGAMEYTQAPVDLDAVRQYRLGRLRQQMALAGWVAVVRSDQYPVRNGCH